jgi:hypothetical protein
MRRFQALRNFNAFPHAEDHLLQKTFSGAIGMLLNFVFLFLFILAHKQGQVFFLKMLSLPMLQLLLHHT